MPRSVLSVIAGYMAMAIIVMLGTIAATAALVPGGIAAMKNSQGTPPSPSKPYLYTNLLLSLFAAVVGGWLTARLAPGSPLTHAIALAVVVLVMSVVTARTQKTATANQPGWYPATIAAIGVVGVLLGGYWRFSTMQ